MNIIREKQRQECAVTSATRAARLSSEVPRSFKFCSYTEASNSRCIVVAADMFTVCPMGAGACWLGRIVRHGWTGGHTGGNA